MYGAAGSTRVDATVSSGSGGAAGEGEGGGKRQRLGHRVHRPLKAGDRVMCIRKKARDKEYKNELGYVLSIDIHTNGVRVEMDKNNKVLTTQSAKGTTDSFCLVDEE